jgi:hypothetical protein
MAAVPQAQEMAREFRMFWCCLYFVERQGECKLVYGYAVSAQQPASQWASNSVSGCAAWRLKKTGCFLTETALVALGQQLLTGRVQLSTKDGDLEISAEGLRQRPTVYAMPRTLLSSGSPQSFSDDPATVDSLWCLAKKDLIEILFPKKNFNSEQVRDATGTLLRKLQHETSISFLTQEAGRFGNFEIVTYLSGDVRRSDGLCSMIFRPELSIVVWIEPPLSQQGNLTINVRMFNSGGPRGHTCILDELRQWEPQMPIRFSPAEPFTDYEVSVWCNGKVTAYQHQSVLREKRSNLTVAGTAQQHVTRWSQSFSGPMRERAERVRLDTSLRMTTRSPHADPWRDSEMEAKALVESWFPTGSKGRFFVNKQESTVEVVEFLAELIRRPDVTRVTIVDPFFDRVGVESLLTRLGDVKDVKVLSSHAPSGAGYVAQTVELAATCEACRQTLPKKLEIINVEIPGGDKQQFHDRYLDIEIESEARFSSREVWMLSNSLSSVAVRYPLVVVPLSPDVVNHMTAYLDLLETGQVVSRPGIVPRVLWTNYIRSNPTGVASSPRLSKEFPGWKMILELLVPDVFPETERPKAAVARGLLMEYIPDIDWHVPNEAVSKVVEAVRAELSVTATNRNALLAALAQWAYHGGPPASEYNFEGENIALIGDALTTHLSDHAETNQRTLEFSALRDAVPLPESLEHVWYLVNQAHLDSRNGATPELFFFTEALWETASQTVVHILNTSRNFALFRWVCLYGNRHDEGTARLLLGSPIGAVQSLGVLFLRNIAEKEAAGGEHLGLLASKLENSSLPRLDVLLSMIFISARCTTLGVAYTQPFAACAGLWGDQPLNEAEHTRIAALTDRAAPNRAIPMIVALADECPIPADASGFRQWCIDQVKAQLPLKPQCPPQPEIRVVPDDFTFAEAAKAAWQLHGGGTSAWFLDDILKKIDPWVASAPLLRAREYSEWSGALEGLLLVLVFGMSLAENAASLESRLEFQTRNTGPMAKALLKPGSELWHHFGDFHRHLAKIVAFLGRSAGTESAPQIEKLLLDEAIPNVWRLLLILQSPSLTGKFASQVRAMVATPTTPASDHDWSSIDEWARDLTSAAEKLSETETDLRELLAEVLEDVKKWRNYLLGTVAPPPPSPTCRQESR